MYTVKWLLVLLKKASILKEFPCDGGRKLEFSLWISTTVAQQVSKS